MSAFTFFFTEASPCSQWYPCRFVGDTPRGPDLLGQILIDLREDLLR